MEVLSSKPVSLSEAKEIFEKRKKEEEELGYEQQQTLEYSEKFAKHSAKDAESLVKGLMKNKKLNEETAIKIADIMPKNVETLKAILLKDKVELSEEELGEIHKQIG